MNKNEQGFGIVEVILILVILGIIGFIGWRVYDASKEVPQALVDNSITQKPQDDLIPEEWEKYENKDLGLTFRYPDSWGEAYFEVMNPQPDELNKTFYKITFEKKHRIITIKPKASKQSFDVTLAQLKDSIKDHPESTYVIVDSSDYVATIVPSNGNQASELYAAKLISLPKIDANTLVLSDSVGYGTVDTCKADAYTDCYSDEDKNEIKLFLQELTSN